jgi:hyperosmotically inducible protein
VRFRSDNCVRWRTDRAIALNAVLAGGSVKVRYRTDGEPHTPYASRLTQESKMKMFKHATPLLAVFAVAGMIGCASTSKSEGTGEYIDDTVITAKVKTAIFEQPGLKSAEINVETFKGVVQLSGFVSSQESANAAVATAKNVKGVSSVKNDMRVK